MNSRLILTIVCVMLPAAAAAQSAFDIIDPGINRIEESAPTGNAADLAREMAEWRAAEARRAAHEKAERERIAREQEAERQRIARERQAERQRIAREQEDERERIARQRQAEYEQEIARGEEIERAKRARERECNQRHLANNLHGFSNLTIAQKYEDAGYDKQAIRHRGHALDSALRVLGNINCN